MTRGPLSIASIELSKPLKWLGGRLPTEFEVQNYLTRQQRKSMGSQKHDGVSYVRHGLAGLRAAALALDAAGISWWLSYGALLGWRRQNELIAYDVDIDIVVGPGTDPDRVRRALAAADIRPVSTVSIRGEITNENYWGRETYLDVFFLITKNGKQYVRSRRHGCCILILEPPVRPERAKFGDVDIWVPDDVDNYLEHLYGPRWKTPDPTWHWLLGPNITGFEGTLIGRGLNHVEIALLKAAKRLT